MENVVKEDVLQALNEFDMKNDIPIPSLLEEYLHFVASTGDTVFPWTIIKVLVRRKIEQVLCDFLITSSPDSVPVSPNVDPFKYTLMKEKILEALEYFTQAPFTIQRLCEVMVDPKRYYKRIDKLMRAIEKNLLVTTTTEPRRPSSPHAHLSGVVNGFEDRTNGHHSEEQEDEPMDITGPPAPCQPVVVGNFGDCPITGKSGEDDDDGIEDIDVDQAPDVVSSHTPPQTFDVTMTEVQQGGSSQENLLQIQLQMREQQQQREQLILVNAGDQSAVEESSSQSSEKSESEETSTRSNEDSCSNDTASDLEQGDTRESQLETELEQQVPQFVLCESAGDPGSSPVQFQSISSQSQESSKTEKIQNLITSSSTTIPTGSSAIVTEQSSVVESSQGDSMEGSNEAAAVADTSLPQRTPNTLARMTSASTTPAAAAAAGTISTSTTPDIKTEESSKSESATAADSQQGSAEKSLGEAELPTTNSPGNEAVAKE